MDRQALLSEMSEATLLSKEHIATHKSLLDELKLADIENKKLILQRLRHLHAAYQEQIKRYDAAHRNYSGIYITEKNN